MSLSSFNVERTHTSASALLLSPGDSTDLLDVASSRFTVIRPTHSLDASSPLLGFTILPDSPCSAEEGELVTIVLEQPLDFRPKGPGGRPTPPMTVSFALEPTPGSSCQVVSADVELTALTSDDQGLFIDFSLAKNGANIVGTPSFILGWESSLLEGVTTVRAGALSATSVTISGGTLVGAGTLHAPVLINGVGSLEIPGLGARLGQLVVSDVVEIDSDPAGALATLEGALSRTDGLVPPPDWFSGATAATLAAQIRALITDIRLLDSDGDGVSNGDEIDAGSDPSDPTDS